MPHFAAIGEAMIELYHENDNRLRLGFAGDTLNTSIYLARLTSTFPLEVHYITALGDDPYSDAMVVTCQREKIDTRYVSRLPHQLPGVYFIRTDETGERHFYFYRSASAARWLFTAEHAVQIESALIRMDYLYLSLITLAILSSENKQRLLAILRSARKRGACIIFDTNYRERLWEKTSLASDAVKEIMSIVDIALVTFEDEQKLFSDKTAKACAARLHAVGVREVVVKCGAEPCLVSYKRVDDYYQANVPASISQRIVDTTAAGDSFNAGYLAARWRNYSPEEAARYGHQLAGCVIQYQGAIIPAELMPCLF